MAASTLRQPGTVTRLSADTFQVIGRQGDAYHVTIRSGDVRCTCPAGRFHRHCWHLDRLAEHLAAAARRSGAVREVFAAGLVWVASGYSATCWRTAPWSSSARSPAPTGASRR
jgi:hypothetical protein